VTIDDFSEAWDKRAAGNFNFTPYIPFIYPYLPPYIPLIYRVYKRLDTH
jgi:hypothetical protein